MAAQITTPIGSRAFELIRQQIGAILADELPQQATLNADPNLNAEVFVERFKPVGDEEVPVVIVGFSDLAPGLKTASSTDGNMTFLIDCYEKAKSTDAEKQADKSATIKLQRLIGVIYGILSHHKYRTLGFQAPFIEHTEIKDIKVAQPKNAKDASSVVMGRIEFIVRAPDKNTASDPVIIDGYSTQALLDLTDLGYTFGNYTLPPVPPVCADVEILLNGSKIVDAESGSTIDLPVVYTNGSVAPGNWDGDKYVVPLGICGDAILNVNGLFLTNIASGASYNLDVIDTDSNNIGSLDGSFWKIANNTITVNSATFLEIKAESNLNIDIKSSDGSAIGTPSGGEIIIADASNTFNGSSAAGVVAEGLKNIIVQTNASTPVQVGTVLVDTVDEMKIEVPEGSGAIGYQRPFKGQTISYLNGDEGWENINNIDPYTPASNAKIAVQDPDDWFKLINDNEFGNKHRFTSKSGGYYDFSSASYKDVNGNTTTFFDEFQDGDSVVFAGYIIDHLTGLGWLSISVGRALFSDFFNTFIPGYNSIGTNKFHGFTNWKIPTLNESMSIRNKTLKGANITTAYGNESPYFAIHKTCMTTTTYPFNTVQQYEINIGTQQSSSFPVATTSNVDATLCRPHYT